jgi:PAS domain S-box-containing protein
MTPLPDPEFSPQPGLEAQIQAVLQRLAETAIALQGAGKGAPQNNPLPLPALTPGAMSALLLQAQQALSEIDSRYQRIVDNANEAILVTQSTQFCFANRKAAELSGYPLDELLHINYIDLVHPDDREMVATLILRELQGLEASKCLTFRYIHKDGSIYTAELKIVRILWDGQPALLGFLTDISGLRQAEASLLANYRKLSILTDLGRELAQTLDLQEICRIAYRHISGLVDCPIFGVSLVEPGSNRLYARFYLQDGEEVDISHLPPSIVGQKQPLGSRSRAVLFSQPVFVTNLGEQVRAGAGVMFGDNRAPESALYLPMIVQNQTVGLLELQSYRQQAYSPVDAEFLAPLTNQIGLSLENARLFQTSQQELQERRRAEGQLIESLEKLRVLSQIGIDLARTIDLGEICSIAHRHVARLVDCPNFGVSIYDRLSGMLHAACIISDGEMLDLSGVPPLPIAACELHRGRAGAILDARPEALSGLAGDHSDPSGVILGNGLDPESALYLPMIVQGQVTGLLEMQSYLPNVYGPAQIELLAPVANQVGLAVENARLYQAMQQELAERRKAQQELEVYSGRLEEMVAARTAELRMAQDKLIEQEKLAMVGRLANTMAHELRNPLGVISNAAYYLKQTLNQADPVTREYLDIIAAQTDDSTRIITSLLEYFHQRPPAPMPNDLPDLLSRLLKKRPPPENVNLRLALAKDLPTVLVDTQQVERVLDHLLVNAYQAMPSGGDLVIRGVCIKDQIILQIADTGAGIAPEDLPHIFEPLFTTRMRGLGLGLALAKGYAEANGGSLEVVTQRDIGSAFSLSLPVALV